MTPQARARVTPVRLVVGVAALLGAIAGIGIAAPAGPIADATAASARVAASTAESTAASITTALNRPSSPAPSSEPVGAVTPSSAGLIPGMVNATSINLTAEYQATVHLNFGTRSFQVSSTMTVTNTSGKAIDRLELNTIAARLGPMTLTMARVDNVPVPATVSDPTIHLPLGGVPEPAPRATRPVADHAAPPTRTHASRV